MNMFQEKIAARHTETFNVIKDSMAEISANGEKIKEFAKEADSEVVSDNELAFNDMFNKLNEL